MVGSILLGPVKSASFRTAKAQGALFPPTRQPGIRIIASEGAAQKHGAVSSFQLYEPHVRRAFPPLGKDGKARVPVAGKASVALPTHGYTAWSVFVECLLGIV